MTSTKLVTYILQKHLLQQDLTADLTGDSQDISQVSSSTMSSRMQDVTSQQDRRKLQVSTWTTSREFGICTQIHQQQTRLHLIQEA